MQLETILLISFHITPLMFSESISGENLLKDQHLKKENEDIRVMMRNRSDKTGIDHKVVIPERVVSSAAILLRYGIVSSIHNLLLSDVT